MAQRSGSYYSSSLLLFLLLIAVQFCARGAAQSRERCLSIDNLGENSLRVEVDCISNRSLPVSYANLIVSGITEDVTVFFVYYSCVTSNGTDISGSVQEDDIDRYIGQKNYNISVPENANCSFTVCYEETTNDYFLMRGTTATCHTALTPAVEVYPQSALAAVGTPIVVRCSANLPVPPLISWSTGTEHKELSGDNDKESIIEVTYNSTGVKMIMCSVKDTSSDYVVMKTSEITVVESLVPLVPRNLSYFTNSSSLRVVWQNPVSGSNELISLVGFNVVVKNKNSIIRNLTIHNNSNSSNNSIELHGLEKFIPYTVEVSAYNEYGYGKPASIDAFIEQGVPVVPPRNITIKRVNSTSIRVKWLPLTLEEAKGFVTSYRVYYQQTTGDNRLDVVVSAEQDSVIINDLEPLLEYSVEVSAITTAGEGQTSNSITPEIRTQVVSFCFIALSDHYCEASAPNASIKLITNYLKQTCSLFPISTRANFTCVNHTCQQQSYLYVHVHAHIWSSNIDVVERELASCIQNESIDGILKISLSNSCGGLQTVPCPTTASPSSTHPALHLQNQTLISVVVVVALTLTILVSTSLITMIIFLKRKTAQPQEFADYVPNVDSSNYSQSHQEKILSRYSFTQKNLPASITSSSDKMLIEKLKISTQEKLHHICRQASQNSIDSVAASNDSSQLQVCHLKTLSNDSLDREKTSHHVIHIV